MRPTGYRTTPGRPRFVYAAAVAAVVLVLIGGVAWLSRSSQLNSVDEPTPTTTTSVLSSPATGILDETDVIDLGQAIPERLWGTDNMIAAGDKLWVGGDSRGRNYYSAEAEPSDLFSIDPATRQVVDQITLAGGVVDLVSESGALWVVAADSSVVRIDPFTGQVTNTIPLPFLNNGDGSVGVRSDSAVAGGGLWVSGGDGIGRIDLESLTLETFAASPDGDAGGVGRAWPATHVDKWLGETDGALWGWRSHNGDAVRVDLATNQFTTYRVVGMPESNAVIGEGAIWAIDERGVVRLDISTGQISRLERTWLPGEVGWQTVVLDGGLWTASDSQVTRIDLISGATTDELQFGTGPVDGFETAQLIATPDGTLWTVGGQPATLTRIDMRARAITGSVVVGEGGQLLAFDGAIWIAAEDGTVARVGSTGNQATSAPEAISPVADLTSDAAIAMTAGYFDAFNTGDIASIIRMFTADVRFSIGLNGFGLVDERNRLEYLLAQGALLSDPHCTPTTSRVTCRTGTLGAPAEAIGAPPVATTMVFRLTPEGISQIAFQYSTPGFEDVGDAFQSWSETAHPETVTPDWDSPYRPEDWWSDSVHRSASEARQNGLLVTEYAQEWAASLTARGCTYPDACFENP